jgi:hypothetical protein
MSINSRADVVLDRYARRSLPALDADLQQFLTEEFQRLENVITDNAEAFIQTTDKVPEKPRRGTVRYNVLPWDPLSDTSEGLVVYNGTAWVAV